MICRNVKIARLSEVLGTSLFIGRAAGFQMVGEQVSGNYFQMLGAGIGRGRPLLAGDTNAAVIGESAWKNKFGAAPNIIGRSVQLQGNSYEIVGVARGEFSGMSQVHFGIFNVGYLSSEQVRMRRNKCGGGAIATRRCREAGDSGAAAVGATGDCEPSRDWAAGWGGAGICGNVDTHHVADNGDFCAVAGGFCPGAVDCVRECGEHDAGASDGTATGNWRAIVAGSGTRAVDPTTYDGGIAACFTGGPAGGGHVGGDAAAERTIDVCDGTSCLA